MKRIILISILITFGSLTSSSDPLEKPKNDAHAFEALGTIIADSTAGSIKEEKLVLYLEEVTEPMAGPDLEQLFSENNNTEASEDQNTEKNSDTEKKETQQEPIKVRTKIKCVESVLKKAVIETYCIKGQIKGLQLNGIDEISDAKALHLKSGDIIRAVNGQTLSSKKEAYNIFIKARKKPIMTISLLQDGEARQLLLDLK
jgi:type II secretory pathway component PulC